MNTKDSVKISGVWLRQIGNRIQVLVEHGSTWFLVIEETAGAAFSHIVEPEGIRRSPVDSVTGGVATAQETK
jgi:hypothetical protein